MLQSKALPCPQLAGWVLGFMNVAYPRVIMLDNHNSPKPHA